MTGGAYRAGKEGRNEGNEESHERKEEGKERVKEKEGRRMCAKRGLGWGIRGKMLNSCLV